jgi:hypothetical protein
MLKSLSKAARLGLPLALLLAGGCGKTLTLPQPIVDAGTPDAGTPDAGQPDAGTDAGTDAGVDAGFDAGVDAGPIAYQTARVIVHLHSAISHDACDGHSAHDGGLGARDPVCLQQLEDGICAAKIDVAFLTDHPSYVSDQTREDALLSRPGRGETWELTDGGLEHGNRKLCADGHSFVLATGVEGTHTLPIGLAQKLPDYSVSTDSSATVAGLVQLAQQIHAAGGLYFTAHSEEADLPASLLQQIPSDGMEWYNPHANFKELYGQGGDQIGANGDYSQIGATLNTLKGMEPFLLGGSAQADLLYVLLLHGGFPEAGVRKVHEVLSVRHITAVVGADVHQNVSVTPICKGSAAQLACQALLQAYPNLLTALISGGTVTLSDGVRLDAYARVMRWLNNRVLVTEKSVAGVEDGLRAGRVWSVFAVFGEPGPFAVWADGAQGRVELGSNASVGNTLHVRLPDPPAPELGAQWTPAEAATATVRTVLWRTDAAGKTQMTQWIGTGTEVTYVAQSPGAYTIESWITPTQLLTPLGPKAAELAGYEYRWVMSNPIYVQ